MLLLVGTANEPVPDNQGGENREVQCPQVRSSWCGSVVTNLTGIHEDVGLIPGPAQWVKNPALLQAARRCGSDPVLPWLWCRPAAAALIPPLDWELPYATGVALREKKKKTSHNKPGQTSSVKFCHAYIQPKKFTMQIL